MQQIINQYNRNLEFFKKNEPLIYKKFCNFRPVKSKIYIDDDNEIQVFYKGQKIYQGNPVEACRNQVDSFLKNPHQILYPPVRYPRSDSGLYNYLNKIEDLSSIGASGTLTEYSGKITGPAKSIPLLILAGLGIGYHLEYLIQKIDIKHLIIYEPEDEFFFLALHTIDWAVIFSYFRQNGKSLDIHLNESVKDVLNSINLINPVFIYYSFIYVHLHQYLGLSNSLMENIDLLKRYFVYYDDEIISLQHTVENIKKGTPVYYPVNSSQDSYTLVNYTKHRKLTPPAFIPPAFIIGAGPSLDDAIEVIKKYKGQAIIFSCGSALRTLEKFGIKPDFHMETERTYTTYEALEHIDKNYLKGITFLGNNTVHPDVYSLFKNKLMFLKYNDSGRDTLPGDVPALDYTTPTVVNSATAIALDIGFENIYLFGVDMGFKNPQYHHSKYNISMDKDTSFYQDEKTDLKKIKGNMQDTIYTTSELEWARITLEMLLRNKNVNVYNCSQGAGIDNTIVLNHENLVLEDKIEKSEMLEFIENKFINDHINYMDHIREKLDSYYRQTDYIISMLNEEIKSRDEIIDIFYNMYDYLTTNNLLKGSLLHFLNIIYSHAFWELNEKISVDFINRSFSVMKEFFLQVKKDIKKSIAALKE